jgi:hypothetical protein
MLNYKNIKNDRGNIVSVSANGKKLHFLIESNLAQHPVIGVPINALLSAMDNGFAELADKRADLSEQGFAKAASDLVHAKIAPPWRAMCSAVVVAEAAHVDFYRKVVSFDEPSNGVELRSYLRTLPVAETFKVVRRNPAMLNALVAGGAELSGLADEYFSQFERELHVQNVAAIFLQQRSGEYTIAPSLADPVGGAIDADAVNADASEFVKTMDRKRELLESVRTLLTRMVAAVAIMAGMTPEAALGALSGQEG